MTGFEFLLQASEPYLYGTPVVVDVIDQSLRLVTQKTVPVSVQHHFDLPTGNYGVRVHLPSGRTLTDTVKVREGPPRLHMMNLFDVSVYGWMERTILLKSPILGRHDHLEQPRYDSVWLRLWTLSEGTWKVDRWPAQDALTEPGAARYWFQAGRRQQMLQIGGPQIPWRMVSLPAAERLEVTLRPCGDEAAPGLAVTVATDNNQIEALLGYLSIGALNHAALVAQQAEALLLGKANDPAGAVVEGYYLLRVSDFERLRTWSVNMANWTGWMPDGAIIHAWQLIREQQEIPSRSPAVLQTARARLLEAVERGIPVYTEGLRLLISGLKLIDFEAGGRDEEVSEALDRLRPYSEAADLGQPTTTFTGSSPLSPSVSPAYGLPSARDGMTFLANAYQVVGQSGENMTMDYKRWWEARRSGAQFGQLIFDAWASEYLLSTDAEPEDLVVVDPGNGFNYLFDLAGALRDKSRSRAPRVIGVWGLSQPEGYGRARSRLGGRPRPGLPGDDRGHLISSAAGGGYDINLVPMDAALNRGWSAEGARFRVLERLAAVQPGALFFIRLVYQDDSDRPSRFEAGVQDGEELLIDVFANIRGRASPMPSAVLQKSAAFRIDAAVVEGCLDLASTADSMFARAWRSGPASLTRAERCAVAGVTGHVAESVIELLLDRLDWRVLWHFTGPGRRGVNLVLLTPDDKIVAVEVKGTLVAGRIPRLTRREMAQMSAEWVDKADNPGMAELGLQSPDIYGAVAVVNFADMTWRMALTADFSTLRPVTRADQLTDLRWLTPTRTGSVIKRILQVSLAA